MSSGYRSYVVRVRHRDNGRGEIRLEVEDLSGGRRASLAGALAVALAEQLRALVGGQGPASESSDPSVAPERVDPATG